MHGKPLPSVYHRRKTSLSLRGCYVYSGALTTSLLATSNSSSTWDPADSQGKFPRMYEGDGLRVKDEEEDCTLVIFKRPYGGSGRFGKQGKTRVLRARSMVSGRLGAVTEADPLGRAGRARRARVLSEPGDRAAG